MIIPIQKISTETPLVSDEDKHVQLAQAFGQELSKDRRSAQKNLTQVPIHHATRKNRVALILAPMWAPYVAPYGIARLAGMARHAGFETQCWDINIRCHDATKGELWNYL